LGAAGLVVLQPMYTDIMSAVNNDALVNALAAVFFLAAARAFCLGWSWRETLAGLLALAGQLATKTTGLATLAVLPVGLALYPWRRPARVALAALAMLGIAAVAAAAVLSSTTGHALFEEAWRAFGRYLRVFVPETVQALIGGETRVRYAGVARVVFRSYWAAFGWRHVTLAPIWYWLPAAGMLGAALGLAGQSVRALGAGGWHSVGRRGRFLLFGAAAVGVAWVMAIARAQADQGLGVYHSHGRYAFVTIMPFALLFTAGWLAWLPEAWRRRGLWIYLGALAAFDAIAFWGHLVPFYYFRP
jgi:hypothetical protein